MLPIGLLVMWTSLPVFRRNLEALPKTPISIDFVGAGLLIATAVVFLLPGMHVHGGDETFTSREALSYHLPMHVLFLVLLAVFILVERRIAQPFVDFRHFRHKYFTLSLVSNVAFHLSMLATMVLIPHQSFGIWLPAIAGNIHDKYSPKLLRTFCMLSIAVGFVLRVRCQGQLLVAAPAVVAHLLGHQRFQHGEQRHVDERSANRAPGIRIWHAGDHAGPWPRHRRHHIFHHHGYARAVLP